MPSPIRISLKIVGVLLGIVIISWIGVAVYVQLHKKELLQTLTNQLNNNLNGKLTIGSMEPALIRGFPGISVSLTNVLLRDSLWDKHRHNLLNAKIVFLEIDAFSILQGDPTIKKISVKEGSMYLFTDSNGYSNTNLFKQRNKGEADGGTKKINEISLDNVIAIIENKSRHKLFNFSIHTADAKIKYHSTGWEGKTKLNILVNNLAFNTKNGSFLKKKTLKTNLNLAFDDKSKKLSIPVQKFEIGDDRLNIGGNFSFSDQSSEFNLSVDVPKITLKDAASLLAENISSKINRYSLKESLSAKATIIGDLKSSGDPNISVTWETTKNTISVNKETITNCSFKGEYNNQLDKNKDRNDANSIIAFYDLSGEYYTLPFSSDTVQITNLKNSLISGKFIANYPLTKLNALLGKNTFVFTDGQASVNLIYKAPFNSKSKSARYLKGIIQIKNAAAKYQPRNISFKNGSIKFNFTGKDLYLENIAVQSGNNTLRMSGSVKNFSNFYYTDPQKIVLDWQINSPQLNLNDFMGFITNRTHSSRKKSDNTFAKDLENLITEARARVRLRVDKLTYKKFIAQNVVSDIELNEQGISLNKVTLSHAGGRLTMNGNLSQGKKTNTINLNSTIINANVKELFNAFDNFGQDAITYQHLRGSLDAKTSISAVMIGDMGTIQPRSIKGTVNFNLKNGALINFEPMQKIGNIAFRNRDFSNISFKSLSNTLTFNKTYVTIPPMVIESSVLTLFIGGIYGFTSGTNISLSIPLRNPEKDKLITDKEERRERLKKGIVINLHAVDGDDGNVKFKLGKGT